MEDKNEMNSLPPEKHFFTPGDIPPSALPEPDAQEDTSAAADFVASFFGDPNTVPEDLGGEMPEMDFSRRYAQEMEFATAEELDDAYFDEDPSVEQFLNETDDDRPVFSGLDATLLYSPQDNSGSAEAAANPELVSESFPVSDYFPGEFAPEDIAPAASSGEILPEEEPVRDIWESASIDAEYLPDAHFVPEGALEDPLPNAAPVSSSDSGNDQRPGDMQAMGGQKKKKSPKKTPQKAVRKGRPKRKKGDGLWGLPHLAVTAVWLAIIVLIGSTLGKLLWVGAADVLAFGRVSKDVTLTITDTDDLDSIALKLQEAGLIKYPALFKLYIQITDSEDEIITGYFELNTNLDYHALVNSLSPSSSSRSVTEVMIPEGYSCRQVFALLEENHVCSAAALEAYAANGEFSDYWFLADVERGDKYCLEGFLFPDTYQFYVNSTPKEALTRLLNGFENRFSDEMRAELSTLNERFSAMMRAKGCSEEYIAENQLTIQDVVIIASMIEEETASTSENSTIASVIYNRLSNVNAYDRYLNIDASIYYALDGNVDPETGAVMALTKEDLQLDSPFNTYTNPGLTPTPISNPGLASLQAALDPADTQYYYYVLNPETRLHQFSKTLEEHEKWVQQFNSGD